MGRERDTKERQAFLMRLSAAQFVGSLAISVVLHLPLLVLVTDITTPVTDMLVEDLFYLELTESEPSMPGRQTIVESERVAPPSKQFPESVEDVTTVDEPPPPPKPPELKQPDELKRFEPNLHDLEVLEPIILAEHRPSDPNFDNLVMPEPTRLPGEDAAVLSEVSEVDENGQTVWDCSRDKGGGAADALLPCLPKQRFSSEELDAWKNGWSVLSEQRWDHGIEAYRFRYYGIALSQWLPIAEEGNPVMQFFVGYLYTKVGDNEFGTDDKRNKVIEPDPVEAMRWLRLSAAQGHPGAQYFIGKMYEEGEGVAKNFVESYKWVLLASGNGGKKEVDIIVESNNRDSGKKVKGKALQRRLIKLENRLKDVISSSEINKALELAQECIASNYLRC